MMIKIIRNKSKLSIVKKKINKTIINYKSDHDMLFQKVMSKLKTSNI